MWKIRAINQRSGRVRYNSNAHTSPAKATTMPRLTLYRACSRDLAVFRARKNAATLKVEIPRSVTVSTAANGCTYRTTARKYFCIYIPIHKSSRLTVLFPRFLTLQSRTAACPTSAVTFSLPSSAK